MFRATVKSLLSRKLRLLLSGLAVVLGVMAVSGAIVLTDTLGRSFESLFRTANSGVDVQVTGERNVDETGEYGEAIKEPVPAALVEQVAAVPGVREATGEVQADGARVIGPDGKVLDTPGTPRFGMSWHGEDDLIQLRDGRGPTAPGEIAINAALAEEGGFEVGDRVKVITLEPAREFAVVGVFGFSGDRDSLNGETRVALTEDEAQRLMLGDTDAYSTVQVKATDTVSNEELRDRVAAAVAGDYTVQTGEQAADEQAGETTEFLNTLRLILLGFAGVALFVGIFLILNTFSILVAQRTHELALYRAMGASRGQVARSVLIEAVAVGVIAATLGMLAGLGIGTLLKAAFEAQTGAEFPDATVRLPTAAIIASYAVGVTVTVVAALLPALRASRVPPIAAMREAAIPDRPLTRLTIAGTVPAALGVAATSLALFGDPGDALPMLLFVGILLVFIGAAMLTPAISRPVVGVLGRVFAWSTSGRLGQRNSARNPRRTAITASALMIGIALVTGVSVIASSSKASIEKVVAQDLTAELVITGDVGRFLPTYDAQVIERVRQMPGVDEALAVYLDGADIEGTSTRVSAGDVPLMAQMFSLQQVAGELRTLAPGETVIDDELAEDHGLAVGDTFDMITQRGGERPFTVVGVYESSNLLEGPVLSTDDGKAYFALSQPSQGYISVADVGDTDAVQAQVATQLADSPEVSVRDRSGFQEQQASQINTFLTMLYVLLGLAIIIAALGIVNTLTLSILERTREVGLLRAVGMRRRHIRRMITVESVVIAVFGALLGAVIGIALGAAAVRALRSQGVTEITVPWGTLALFLVLAVAVGLFAAVIPAIRAARTNVLRAIAYE